MASKPWVTSGGNPIVNSSGQIIECETCPCGAPSTCPCGSWPDPATSGDFPCGGLPYQLTLSAYSFIDTGWDGGDCGVGTAVEVVRYRLKSDIALTAVGGESCTWRGSGVMEVSIIGGSWSDTGTIEFTATLNGATPAWELRNDSHGSVAKELDAPTPAGDYAMDYCYQEIGFSYRHESGSATLANV